MPLSDMETKNWTHYITLGERLFLRKGATIYEEGSMGKGDIFYLENGKVKVYTAAFTGRVQTLEIIHAGTAFGEQTVDKNPYFSTTVVLEDAVVYRFPSKVANTLVKKDLNFRFLMYDSLRSKLELLVNNLVLHSLPAEKLLAHTLLEVSKKYDHQSVIPLSQKELSQYTGLTRITIYKIFKKWGPEVVQMKNKKIFIDDIQRIEDALST